MLMLRRFTFIFSLFGLTSLFLGCGDGGGNSSAFPPVAVDTCQTKANGVIEKLPAVGSIEAEEWVEIKPQTGGIIETINFEEGQCVKKGDLLIKLESRKEEAELANAEASLKLASLNYERAKKLFIEKNFSQKEVDEAAATYHVQTALVERWKDSLRDKFLYAPFDGRLGARRYSVGQYVEPNSTITSLFADEKVKITFYVPEKEVSQLKPNQKVELKVATFPDEIFLGEIYLVDTQVDVTTRMLKIKALVDNPKQRLKAGMFANVEVIINERPNAITLPEESILTIGENFSVFVVEEGTAKLRSVKLGIRLPGEVEVVEGLKEGEEVIVSGLQKVSEGTKVIATPRGTNSNKVSFLYPHLFLFVS